MSEYKIKDLEVLLRDSLGDIKVLDVKSNLLTAPGENYGSIMQAIDVTLARPNGSQETHHLVAKFLPASETLRIAFQIEITFKKEMYSYTKIIPALVEFQRANNVEPARLLDSFAKCHGARIGFKGKVDDDAVMIFENLKVQGYQMADRLIGCTFEESRVILKDLAKFHAIALAYRLKHPVKFEEFKTALPRYAGPNDEFSDIEKSFFESVIETAKKFNEFTPYLKKIEEYLLIGVNEMKSLTPSTSKFATIQHCDFWVNNTMLLKDSTGKTLKNKIVDLQIMTCDSGVRDLMFFLLTSVTMDDLDKHYDDLVKIYYDTFIEYLNDFDIDLSDYSWESFLEEINVAAVKEFQHVTFMLKPIFTERGKIESMETFDNDTFASSEFLSPIHSIKMRKVISMYIDRKWLK